MTNESKKSPKSGSGASESMTKNVATTESTGTESAAGSVRLKSLLKDGGEMPGLGGLYVPREGEVFEASAEQGRALLACGYAEVAGETAKGE